VILQSGALKLSTRATATHDARVGDLVICINPQSEERFQGIVQEDGTVLVQ
jgi:flagella basal body P-ring formation protein FlgA